jgi:CRISPR/Cas system-associated exonuclease Cas4 (RecB family)
MKDFLDHIAEYIISRPVAEIEKTWIIFPTRRPIQFLIEKLSKQQKKPFLLPQMMGIDELVSMGMPYTMADTFTLNSKLYHTFRKNGMNQESYDMFYSWGEMLLGDFNEIDKYLVDTDQLFKMLLGDKEITQQFFYLDEEQIAAIKNFWNSFDPEKISNEQESFLQLWKLLPSIYQDFQEDLEDNHLIYKGKAYRKMAENPEQYLGSITEAGSHFIICGFSELSASEIKIFEYLQKNFSSTFFWDVDEYYCNYEFHEAGDFYRKFKNKFPSAIPPQKELDRIDKKINIYDVSKFIAQAQIVSKQFENSDHTGTSAIILPDNNRLPVLLASLDTDTTNLNITMGVPLKTSLASSFFNEWIDLFKHTKNIEGLKSFHYQYIFRFLKHPFVFPLIKNEYSSWEYEMISTQQPFILPSQFPEAWSDIKSFIEFPESGNQLIKQLCTYLYNYINNIVDPEDKNTDLQTELLIDLYQAFKRLHETIIINDMIFSVETAVKIMRQYISQSNVPFQGDYTAELQVMGLIETQCMDFENIFIVDCNEGILPGTSNGGSYIPYAMRKAFGMPTKESLQRMYAYYFYRLLHHGKNVYLFYNSVTDGQRSSEPSRYIQQLKAELQHTQWQEFKLNNSFTLEQNKSIEIKKTPDIIEILNRYTHYGEKSTYLTPSALNTYLDCSLKFYFRYIASVKEPNQLSEDVDSAVFGNLLHHAMQTLYEKGIDENGTNEFDSEKVTALFKNVESAIHLAFHWVLHQREDKQPYRYEGEEIIAKEIITRYVHSILKHDAKQAPFTMLKMEKKDEVLIPCGDYSVRIGGKIDRLDIRNGTLRIIDYKTGSAENKNEFNNIEDLFNFHNDKRAGYIFQVMVYAYIMDLIRNEDEPIKPGLLFIRKIYTETFDSHIYKKNKSENIIVNDYRPYREEVEFKLKSLIQHLMSPENNFTQTTDVKTCTKCAYKNICRKD